MRAGRLRKRVAFKGQVLTPDGGGGQAVDWDASDFERFGDLRLEEPRASAEGIEGGAMVSTVRGTLKVRADSSTRQVTSEWAVEIEGEAWNVLQVLVERERGKVTMLVEQGGAV